MSRRIVILLLSLLCHLVAPLSEVVAPGRARADDATALAATHCDPSSAACCTSRHGDARELLGDLQHSERLPLDSGVSAAVARHLISASSPTCAVAERRQTYPPRCRLRFGRSQPATDPA